MLKSISLGKLAVMHKKVLYYLCMVAGAPLAGVWIEIIHPLRGRRNANK
jgi:hypothetical protein